MLGEALVAAALEDWRRAPLDDRLKAACAVIEAMCATPPALTPARFAPLRAAGVSRAGLDELVEICALFNTIVRLADTLDFAMVSPEQFRKDGKFLLKRGYL